MRRTCAHPGPCPLPFRRGARCRTLRTPSLSPPLAGMDRAMLPEALPPPKPPPEQPRPFTKVRFRFRKSADLRLLSHHDLMRTFERLLRRAEMPVRQTRGFHPKPRLVFALSLPLGVVGCEEVGELELDEPLAPEEVHARLARHAPPGL